MKRVIKFKFWCKGTDDNANFNKPGWWSIHNHILNKYYPFELVLSYPEHEFWNHFDLVQFTGLLDKNDKEIYEGDILEDFDYPVEFSLGQFGSRLIYDQIFLPLADCKIEELVVIGNIFESPELLKNE